MEICDCSNMLKFHADISQPTVSRNLIAVAEVMICAKLEGWVRFPCTLPDSGSTRIADPMDISQDEADIQGNSNAFRRTQCWDNEEPPPAKRATMGYCF